MKTLAPTEEGLFGLPLIHFVRVKDTRITLVQGGVYFECPFYKRQGDYYARLPEGSFSKVIMGPENKWSLETPYWAVLDHPSVQELVDRIEEPKYSGPTKSEPSKRLPKEKKWSAWPIIVLTLFLWLLIIATFGRLVK